MVEVCAFFSACFFHPKGLIINETANKMRRTPYLLLAMAVMLSTSALFSCSRDEEPEEKKEQEGKKVVDWENEDINGDATMAARMMQFNVQNVGTLSDSEVATRGSVGTETTDHYTFALNDLVTIKVDSKDPKVYKITNTTTGKLEYNGTPSTDGFYWESKDDINVTAWSYGSGTEMTNDPNGQTFNLETNQKTYGYQELLYMSETPKNYEPEGKVSLNLEHMLSRVIVNLTHDLSSSLSVTEVSIGDGNLPIKATFSPENSKKWTAPNTNTGTIKAKEESETCYSAVLIPTTYTESMKFIQIETENDGTYAYSLPSDIELLAGKQYKFNITIKDGVVVSVSTSISNWNEKSGLIVKVGNSIKRNPLWYVAEYNISENSLTMGTSDNVGYYFSWTDAMSKFAAQSSSYTDYKTGNKTITNAASGTTWHLPTQAEWWSIVPGDETNIFGYVSSSTITAYKSDYITPMFGYNSDTKAGISESSYFRYVSATERHAIRFLGTDYCSAWKYELLGGWSSSNYGYMRVSATLIDNVGNSSAAAAAWYTANWSSVTFGNNESALAVQRVFYARGYHSGGSYSTPNNNEGSVGRYWTTRTSSGSAAYYLHFTSSNAFVNQGGTYSDARSVRLFRDN